MGVKTHLCLVGGDEGRPGLWLVEVSAEVKNDLIALAAFVGIPFCRIDDFDAEVRGIPHDDRERANVDACVPFLERCCQSGNLLGLSDELLSRFEQLCVLGCQ